MRLLCLLLLGAALVASSPHLWTKLILTHHWPCTFCSMEHCHSKIDHWTLHGLWPDNGMNCNSSWHFNSTEIEDLLDEMKENWPDLLSPSSTGFWKYEWHKHGTCAAKAACLDSQHKYFSKALELYHKLDLNSVLTKFNITPSEKYYPFPAIEAVIENFYGAKPKIQCAHPSKDADVQVLGQIEICFDTSFTLTDCEKQTSVEEEEAAFHTGRGRRKLSGFMVCDHNTPVYYPPLP